MTAIVLRADARALPLPDASVDLIVTSPPYYALRDYRDGDGSLAGQIGSEATPAAYVAALLACTREWMRVLKPQGSMWINLGDKYSGAQAQNDGRPARGDSAFWQRTNPKHTGIPNKSLMGLPWRYALGCIDQLGLILRAEIIWAKPNGLPESVTDRVRRSHEQVLHFTRQPRYYSAVDEIREPHAPASVSRYAYSNPAFTGAYADHDSQYGRNRKVNPLGNPLGKLPGSVWEIASQPLTVPAALGVDHFAAWPMEVPRRIIAGWSPPGICTACGEGRRPVADRDYRVLDRYPDRRSDSMAINGTGTPGSGQWEFATRKHGRAEAQTTITGYACACPQPDAPTRPATVLDPFSGTGTTMLVASALGRIGIGTDRSMDYTRLARWRTTDPAQRAAAMQVPKPPPQADGQADLFEGMAG